MKPARLKPVNQETISVKEIPIQPASQDIWDKKYRLKSKNGQPIDETVDDTYRRVARALADVEETPDKREEWYEKFLWALRQGAIPAGRIISNAGAWEHKPATSTINCTVSGTIRDSMDDILQKVHEAGLTLKSGAGIGYEFSTLRPRGAYVSGAGAHTSGPMSFMDIYDKMCFTVSSAGGRRGAQMGTFDVGHPDVMEFIRAKRESGRLRQFNLSLLITREFMEAVKDNADWPLAFPLREREVAEDGINLDDPDQVIWREWPTGEALIVNETGQVACKIYKTMPARRLWDMIMASTYDYAEPGFILIDQYNTMNNNWFCENIRASNPCVAADTWVHTDRGPRQVSDLIGKPFNARLDGENHASGAEGFFLTATKSVVKLITREGYEIRLTRDHKIRRVINGVSEWVAAGDLSPGDEVRLNDHKTNPHWKGRGNRDEGYLLGLLMGDGTIRERGAILSVWKAESEMTADGTVISGTDGIMSRVMSSLSKMQHRSDFKGWYPVVGRNEYRIESAAVTSLAKSFGMRAGNKVITQEIEQASSLFTRGFLQGLFDADGSVQGSQEKGVSVRLSQSSVVALKATQRMLLRLGIASKIYENRREACLRDLPNGQGEVKEYATKGQHELVIVSDNLLAFQKMVGFADHNKATRLSNALGSYKRRMNQERFTATLVSLVDEGEEAVYDVQVPGGNAFDANGLHAHNCGEQGLPPYGSCLLGSINLTKFVLDPFTDQARFDWNTYRKVVAVFTRMLDNVVEINGLPLEQQRREITGKRRHGMGYLGLGSTLTMLRMKYGSPESLEFTEQVTKELALEGWRTALELAREKGPAPILEQDFEVTAEMLARRPEMVTDGYKVGGRVRGRVLHARYSRYMQRVAEADPELVKELTEVGARFTHHSSIAPTGTISLSLANNASNGIEPSFAHHYSRNVIREGRKSKEKVDVFSFELLAYKELINPWAMPLSENPEEQLPDYFITADDIKPREHVDIQAAAQQWIDSSISKTANVPTDFPYEDFKDIYLYAYARGLKGCTTFRFNPEAFQGVLVKDKDLANTTYRFTLEDGSIIEVKGNEEIEYDGEVHTAANLFDALKEGYYGKY